ncbi:hypothetical protein QFZ64_002040 [Streptomyces sp. B3I8]|nr:hypothetical protein [Streptomyces sp. B3I8]
MRVVRRTRGRLRARMRGRHRQHHTGQAVSGPHDAGYDAGLGAGNDAYGAGNDAYGAGHDIGYGIGQGGSHDAGLGAGPGDRYEPHRSYGRPYRRTHQRRAVRRGGSGHRRTRRLLVLLLGCLPGAAVALVLAFCAVGAAPTGARSAHPAAPTRHPATALAHTAVRPAIVPRSRWAGEGFPAQPPPRYDDRVVAIFVHHTDSPNGYDCADAPRIIRALYQGQTDARQWDDIGYNFLVDRCGTIYEGRAGGVDRPVTGAHTQGFNHRTTGIAAIGTFTAGTPVPREMTDAIAALAAWKLGLSDIDPRSRVALVSSNGGSRYAAGATALLPAVAGHDAGYQTSCPGAALSAELPGIRARAALLQGRT